MAFTFFFRDEQILTLAVQKLVPQTMGRSSIHILNAGCAMGMETYTFAILLAESMGKFALRNVKILAVDIDNENVDFGKTVTDGVYHKDHLQRIPSDLFGKYFSPSGKEDHFIVNQELRSLVQFKKYDLLTLKPLRNDYSLVICKNVLLHFHYQQRIEVISMYYDMLITGGLLAMENTQSMPQELSHKFRKLVDYAQLYEKI
ncbi:MAG: chemotaxis protein CheR [Bacteroidales bacterium]|nr:chemotaxis protein CheR [Bacteroidales bacterium]